MLRAEVVTSPVADRSGVLAVAMFKWKSNERDETGPEPAPEFTPPTMMTGTDGFAASLALLFPAPEQPAPVLNVGSERMHIIEEQVRDQRALLDQAEQEFKQETAGLKTHLHGQAATLEAILGHIEQRLRPLREYIAREESNLDELVEDITSRREDFVAENFGGYIAAQKAGIEVARGSIERQRNPFVEYFEEQMAAVELSLKRFDPFIQRLATNLDEQQQILEGFLTAMRDDQFRAARDYLDGRAATWKQFVASGEIDLADTYSQLQQLRDGFAPLAAGQQHLADLLLHTAAADERLGSIVRRADAPVPAPADQEEERPLSAAGFQR